MNLATQKEFDFQRDEFRGKYFSYSNYVAVLFRSPTCQGPHP